jgi:hypothetical protein
MSHEAITEEVQALERLDLEGLRDEWRRRCGPPPSLRSPDLLRRMLAWRIQAEAFGGLDAETRRRLRQASSTRAQAAGPSLGSRLTREWKGVAHEVEVVADGFIHHGRKFSSLSQVARTITGVRWNGPRFFGLRGEDQDR